MYCTLHLTLQAFSPLSSSLAGLDMRLVGKQGLEAPTETLALLRCHRYWRDSLTEAEMLCRLLEVAARLSALEPVVHCVQGEWVAGEVPQVPEYTLYIVQCTWYTVKPWLYMVCSIHHV